VLVTKVSGNITVNMKPLTASVERKSAGGQTRVRHRQTAYEFPPGMIDCRGGPSGMVRPVSPGWSLSLCRP
jgi:hypothetical protein